MNATAPTHAPMTLADYVRDLTRRHQHREQYAVEQHNPDGSTTIVTGWHTTDVPPLLDQLEHAEHQTDPSNDGRAGYSSKPPGRLDSLDALAFIDHHAARWIRVLGGEDPGSTVGCVRRLHSMTPAMDRTTHADVSADIRRWWTLARTVTGWDCRAFRPANTCPWCGTRGSLRLKVEVGTAVCVQCHEVWEQGSLWLLADHIRAENDEDGVPAPVALIPDTSDLAEPVDESPV